MSAERAARLILDPSSRGNADAVIQFTVRQAAKLAAVFPNTTVAGLAAINQLLPGRRTPVAAQGRHCRCRRWCGPRLH